MLRNTSQTEDVLQEAVMEAWRLFPEFTLGTNFKAWVFRFLTHKILNANRRVEAVHMGDIPVELSVEELWAGSDAEGAFVSLVADPHRFSQSLEQPLAAALARLSPPERACLLLKAIGAFTYQEIHELLEIPVGSVMGYLSRARRRMRLFLADHAAERRWPRHLDSIRGETADDASSSSHPSSHEGGHDL
jgi:RNA polymerase sigma-70 factor (ECF subfamily)